MQEVYRKPAMHMLVVTVTQLLFIGSRFTYVKGISDDLQRQVEKDLADYWLNADTTGWTTGLLENPDSLCNFSEDNLSLEEQYDILSCLPNFHWDVYPKVGCKKK